jgi:hypothetical protein
LAENACHRQGDISVDCRAENQPISFPIFGDHRNAGRLCLYRTCDLHRLAAHLDLRAGRADDVGDPLELFWYAEGRVATVPEIRHSIETGLPILRGVADEDGPEARAELEQDIAAFEKMLPEE